VQLAVCLCLIGCALLLQGTAVLLTLGLAVSASYLVGAWHLTSKVRRHLLRAFFGIQALMHAPELAWVAGGVGYLRGKPRGHL
jgi:uncharacterized YccA/Bax inhibitor family protein